MQVTIKGGPRGVCLTNSELEILNEGRPESTFLPWKPEFESAGKDSCMVWSGKVSELLV